MKIINTDQLKDYRASILLKQNDKCAICKKDLPEGNDVGNVDHQHLFKADELEVCGNGLIRGVLCRECNVLEGKIWNAAHRYGKAKSSDPVNSRIEWLENLLDYYKNNCSHHEPVLHPSEKREPKLQKSEYNKLIKFYKTLPTSYKKNGDLKSVPKFTGRWSQTLTKLKEQLEYLNAESNG